jgi:uncharacterized SAM-binding protein YcdF (DUF218 family)
MRRLFSLVFKLLVAALVIFLLTAVWIVLDGLSDAGQKADVALVTGYPESPRGHAAEPRMDRVIQLYNDGEFPFIVVSGPTDPGGYDQPDAMAKYLESGGIPASAIIEENRGEDTQDAAHDMAGIMKSHQFQSVMLVTDYYRMTRARLALTHEGVADIQKVHVGKLRKEDAWKIGREVVALYDYIGKTYLLPAAEKAREEAQAGMDKAKTDVKKAKEKVDKSLDNMAK